MRLIRLLYWPPREFFIYGGSPSDSTGRVDGCGDALDPLARNCEHTWRRIRPIYIRVGISIALMGLQCNRVIRTLLQVRKLDKTDPSDCGDRELPWIAQDRASGVFEGLNKHELRGDSRAYRWKLSRCFLLVFVVF